MKPSPPRNPLTPKQRIALIEMAAGEKPRIVAYHSGVSLRTLYRWRKNPAFQQELAAALDDYDGHFPQEQAAARIIALQALADIARWSQPLERIRAASTLLTYFERQNSDKKPPRKRSTPASPTT